MAEAFVLTTSELEFHFKDSYIKLYDNTIRNDKTETIIEESERMLTSAEQTLNQCGVLTKILPDLHNYDILDLITHTYRAHLNEDDIHKKNSYEKQRVFNYTQNRMERNPIDIFGFFVDEKNKTKKSTSTAEHTSLAQFLLCLKVIQKFIERKIPIDQTTHPKFYTINDLLRVASDNFIKVHNYTQYQRVQKYNSNNNYKSLLKYGADNHNENCIAKLERKKQLTRERVKKCRERKKY
jgi:hypothetical protein